MTEFNVRQVTPQGEIRILSYAPTLAAARVACRAHLLDDKEEGPLEIVPVVNSDEVVATAELIDGVVLFRSYSRGKAYE